MKPLESRESRLTTWIFPREIVRSEVFLSEVETGLSKLADKPALIVWGEQDGAFRTENRLRLMKYFPNHKLRLLSTAKHYIQENAPDEISAAIRELL